MIPFIPNLSSTEYLFSILMYASSVKELPYHFDEWWLDVSCRCFNLWRAKSIDLLSDSLMHYCILFYRWWQLARLIDSSQYCLLLFSGRECSFIQPKFFSRRTSSGFNMTLFVHSALTKLVSKHSASENYPLGDND